MDSSVYLLVNTVASFLSIYSVLLIIRILLTWFPTIDWYSQPFAALSQLTDPYLNIFRSIIPPLGGIDFSPMLAIFALQLISQYLPRLLATVVSLAISSVA
jgi:YggT family protein